MDKWAFIFLKITFASVVLSQDKSEFTHIGSFRSENRINFDENDYFVSPIQTQAQWSSADHSCRVLFGPNASIVSVETEAEWAFLKVMLDIYGIASTYWTSGMYDPGSRVWRWSANNLPIVEWAPWDNGHPANTPAGVHRILISHVNQYAASWRTVPNTQMHRYICERLRPPPEPITCYKNDLVIVLDSSASIGSHNYKKAKEFAAQLFTKITVDASSRIGFLIYSESNSTIVYLNNTLTQEEIANAIKNAPYLKGSTATHLGVDGALVQFYSFPRTVRQNLVVITDGESDDSTLTAAAIRTAIDRGVRTFAVGISPSANQTELLVIANGNSDYVFSSDRCDELLSLLDRVTQKVCNND